MVHPSLPSEHEYLDICLPATHPRPSASSMVLHRKCLACHRSTSRSDASFKPIFSPSIDVQHDPVQDAHGVSGATPRHAVHAVPRFLVVGVSIGKYLVHVHVRPNQTGLQVSKGRQQEIFEGQYLHGFTMLKTKNQRANPFRAAVPVWGQTTEIPKSVFPQRVCSSK